LRSFITSFILFSKPQDLPSPAFIARGWLSGDCLACHWMRCDVVLTASPRAHWS
jgi:hypothetical protein